MQLISAAYAIPITAPSLADAGIVIDGGKIVDSGTLDDLTQKYPSIPRKHFAGHVLMPGLVNAHTHLDLSKSPKLPYDARSSYAKWLLAQQTHKSAASKAFIQAAVAEGLDEAIRAGTTCIGDMDSFDGARAMIQEKKIRAVLFSELAHFTSEASQDHYQSALAAIEQMQEHNESLDRIGLGPYAPFLLSRQLLKIIAHHAHESQVPVQIHVAQTFHEMEFFFDSKGDLARNLFPTLGWGDSLPLPHQRTPVQYLHSIDFLQCRPILVSPVHLAPSDIALIAVARAKIVHCPRANAYLHEGTPAIKACQQAGIPIGLGTESRALVDNLSMWDEMRACLGNTSATPSHLTASDVLKLATLGGATVLGLDPIIGSFELGKNADYIVVKLRKAPASLDHLADTLVKETRAEDVVRSAVNGTVLFERSESAQAF